VDCCILYLVTCRVVDCLCVGLWRSSWCRRCRVWTQWAWTLWRKVSWPSRHKPAHFLFGLNYLGKKHLLLSGYVRVRHLAKIVAVLKKWSHLIVGHIW